MHNISKILDLWRSDADLARDLDLPYPTVAAWRQRGSIPAIYWRSLLRAAKRRRFEQVTADLLANLHAREVGSAPFAGFAEQETSSYVPAAISTADRPRSGAKAGTGHFSRYRHLRRSRFQSAEEIEDHVRALREEWSHR
jgi:hypothetical protein